MRIPWGRVWLAVAVIAGTFLALAFVLQLLDVNLVTTLFPVDSENPAPYG